MNEDERHDLLIRLETKISEMCNRLGSVERELKKRQCLLHQNQIATIEKNFDPMKCSKNSEKIAVVEKLTWAALLTGVTLIIKSFWSAVNV